MMGEDAEGMEEMTGVPLEAVTRNLLAELFNGVGMS